MKKHYLLLFILSVTNVFWGQTKIFNKYLTHGITIDTETNTLFLANTSVDKIHRINLNDPNYNHSVLLSNVDSPEGITFNNGFLYASLNSDDTNLDKIIKINTSETNPIPITVTNSIPNPNGLLIHNNTLYVSSGRNIYTIDLSDKNASPFIFVNNLTTNSSRIGLCILNDYLYIIDEFNEDTGKLVRFDINSSNPIKEVVFDNFWGHGLATKNNKIYTAFYPGSILTTEIVEIDPINKTQTTLYVGSEYTNWDIFVHKNTIFASGNHEISGIVKYTFKQLSVKKFTSQNNIFYPNPASKYINFKAENNLDEIKI